MLITPDSLHREDQALAVLAHELAHIRRRDWLFLALSWLVVALFWFNPLVWWLHRALAARTEEAADAAALSEIDPQTYARTLLDLASEPAWPAALAIGDDFNTLKKRIARIMSDKPALPPRPVALAVAVGALIAVATPLAAIELTHRRADPVAPAAQERQASAAAPERPVAEAPTPAQAMVKARCRWSSTANPSPGPISVPNNAGRSRLTSPTPPPKPPRPKAMRAWPQRMPSRPPVTPQRLVSTPKPSAGKPKLQPDMPRPPLWRPAPWL
ncbi:MAG: M48 family metalloprotease [Brevundimonas sp.]|nr:MAG: M48 family metalloprotease [Brevundimonas sp.]